MILFYILLTILLLVIGFFLGCRWELSHQDVINTQYIQYAKHNARKDQSFITGHAGFIKKVHDVNEYKEKHKEGLYKFFAS